MTHKKVLLVVALGLVAAAWGCSHGMAPIEPSMVATPTPAEAATSDPHGLWGLYALACDLAAGTIDIEPLREAEMHLNALHFLEPPAYVNVTLESKPKINGNILDIDIGLRHPFLGQNIYTGFDVCGIMFSHGSVTGYADPDVIMAGEGDTRLLNADGYTRWWNPAEFPHNDTMFAYKNGLLGTPSENADFNCTINGYKYFTDELGKDDPLSSLDPANRGVFSAGGKNIRHYKIDMSGSLIFNYAVDACWKKPLGTPPYTVPDDFPEAANRPEAWNITVTELENSLYFKELTGKAGGALKLQIWVYDHFSSSLNQVSVESFAGLPYTTVAIPVDSGPGYSIYELTLEGDALHQSGSAEMLITVASEATGYGGLLPGKSISAYFKETFSISSEDPCDPDLDSPDTIIVSGCEDQPACTTKVTLVVSGSDPNYCTKAEELTYEWRKAKDGGAFGPWYPDPSTNIVVKELEAGDWQIQVRAVDNAGNKDLSPAECAFNISVDHAPIGWASTWGGAGIMDYAYAGALDGNRSSYVGGYFTASVDFDPGPGVEEYTAVGLCDAFLTKLDLCGNLVWVRTWGSPGSPKGVFVGGMAVSGSGEVYAVGGFTDTPDFDPGPGLDEHASNGDQDAFLSKFDSTGCFQWALTWGGSDADLPNAVAVDAYSNVYVTGLFSSNSVDLDPGPGTDIHDSSDGGGFLSKFDSNGAFQWALCWNAGLGREATDSDGNIYIPGSFGDVDPVDLDPGPGVDEHVSNGLADAFLCKLDSDGQFQWAVTWGGPGQDGAFPVAVDTLGNIWVTGPFENTVDFDPGPNIDEHTSEGGDKRNAFVSGFDPSGGFLWARTWGGPVNAEVPSVGVDGAGNVYASGAFEGTADFDPGAGLDEHTSNGTGDAFVTKFDSNGDFLWARTWGGAGWDEAYCLSIDDNGEAYAAGFFADTVDFDPGPAIDEHTSNGSEDDFLMHLLPNGYWE